MFLGFVGGGRRGQESWVALKLTVLCRCCCSRRCWGVCCLQTGVCCADKPCFVLPASPDLLELLLFPPATVLTIRENLILSSYLYFVRADAVLLHG